MTHKTSIFGPFSTKSMPSRKKAFIIDDEPFVREDLCHLLLKHPEIQIVGEAGSIREGRALFKQASPDIVFLDIQLRGGTGFDLVPCISPRTHIVFFTAHDEYAVRAFEVNALDYLLKPVSAERLAKALDRVCLSDGGQGLSDPLNGDDQVFIKTDQEQRFIAVKAISAVKSIGGNYTSLLLDSKETYTIRQTLKEWEEVLPKDCFIRIHRSVLINVDRIERLRIEKKGTCQLSLFGIEETFEVSRRSAPRLKELAKSLEQNS
jgi:DNA-binding LytR/AlgR family response regulator